MQVALAVHHKCLDRVLKDADKLEVGGLILFDTAATDTVIGIGGKSGERNEVGLGVVNRDRKMVSKTDDIGFCPAALNGEVGVEVRGARSTGVARTGEREQRQGQCRDV